MDDAPDLARKLIIPQTQSLLYGFDGNEARSLSMVQFPVRADPYNVVTEFSILDIPSPYNPFSGGRDPHDESCHVHPLSVVEIPHVIRDGQYKRRPDDDQNSCCSGRKRSG